MLGFVLKKFVSRLLFPLPVCAMLLAAGIAFLCVSRRKRLGVVMILAGTGVLLVTGYGMPARTVLRRLEWRHAPPTAGWTVAEYTGGTDRPVWVVVLGSGMNEDLALAANSRLDPRFLARVVEGVRLLRQAPGATMILSLPGRLSPEDKRALADNLCQTLGVAPERIHLICNALDTVDEAGMVAALVDRTPVVLVTSASHMYRSMLLFRGAGLAPFPSPTDFLTLRPGTPHPFHAADLYPSAENVLVTERAVYECLGIAWATVRGQTPRGHPDG